MRCSPYFFAESEILSLSGLSVLPGNTPYAGNFSMRPTVTKSATRTAYTVPIERRGAMTVYADILFLVDASMDLVVLWLCARLFHRELTTGRLLGTAVFAGSGMADPVCRTTAVGGHDAGFVRVRYSAAVCHPVDRCVGVRCAARRGDDDAHAAWGTCIHGGRQWRVSPVLHGGDRNLRCLSAAAAAETDRAHGKTPYPARRLEDGCHRSRGFRQSCDRPDQRNAGHIRIRRQCARFPGNVRLDHRHGLSGLPPPFDARDTYKDHRRCGLCRRICGGGMYRQRDGAAGGDRRGTAWGIRRLRRALSGISL